MSVPTEGLELRLRDMGDEDRLDELEERIDELESGGGGTAGISIVYALGMTIAVVLSWSRNGSILWCMLHGLFSWGYVIYFVCTR